MALRVVFIKVIRNIMVCMKNLILLILGLAASPTFGQQGVVPSACPDGMSSVLLTLAPTTALPNSDQITLPQRAGSRPLKLETPSPYFRVRMDLCVDNINPEVVHVQQIIGQLGPDSPVQKSVWIEGKSQAMGIADFLLNQTSSNLNVLIRDTAMVKGWNINGESMVSFSSMFRSFEDQELYVNFQSVVVGRLIEGDPFSQELCPVGDTEQRQNWRIHENLEWHSVTCGKLADGHTRRYKVMALTLENPQTGQKWESDPETLGQILNVRVNHHNACDSWVLRIPTATLAITYPEVTPCDEGVLDEAPSPASVEDGSIRYRLRNEDGSVMEGDVELLGSEGRS